MDAMTITYDNRRVVISNKTEKAVAGSALRIAEFILKTPYLLALILLIVVGTAYVSIAYLMILSVKKGVIQQINTLIRDRAQLKQRDAMILHANFCELRWLFDRLVEKGKGFFVFKPLLEQFTIMAGEYRRAEEALKDIAYPQKDELTQEQRDKLVEIFKDGSEDWRDEKMNVYNDN